MAAKDIEGVEEFKRDTSKIVQQLPKELADASATIARDWVAAAQSNAGTGQAQLAAQALGVSQGADGASEISNDSPLFFGSEFGGQGRPETMQFPPHNGRQGYWFYPARRANDGRYLQIWEQGIDKAMTPWSRSG